MESSKKYIFILARNFKQADVFMRHHNIKPTIGKYVSGAMDVAGFRPEHADVYRLPGWSANPNYADIMEILTVHGFTICDWEVKNGE